MSAYSAVTVAVSTDAVQVLAPAETPRTFALIYNNGTGPTYFGGSAVATAGASLGFLVAASGALTLSNQAQANDALWAVAPTARTIHVLSKA